MNKENRDLGQTKIGEDKNPCVRAAGSETANTYPASYYSLMASLLQDFPSI